MKAFYKKHARTILFLLFSLTTLCVNGQPIVEAPITTVSVTVKEKIQRQLKYYEVVNLDYRLLNTYVKASKDGQIILKLGKLINKKIQLRKNEIRTKDFQASQNAVGERSSESIIECNSYSGWAEGEENIVRLYISIV